MLSCTPASKDLSSGATGARLPPLSPRCARWCPPSPPGIPRPDTHLSSSGKRPPHGPWGGELLLLRVHVLSGRRSPALPFWEEKGHWCLWLWGPLRNQRWGEGQGVTEASVSPQTWEESQPGQAQPGPVTPGRGGQRRLGLPWVLCIRGGGPSSLESADLGDAASTLTPCHPHWPGPLQGQSRPRLPDRRAISPSCGRPPRGHRSLPWWPQPHCPAHCPSCRAPVSSLTYLLPAAAFPTWHHPGPSELSSDILSSRKPRVSMTPPIPSRTSCSLSPPCTPVVPMYSALPWSLGAPGAGPLGICRARDGRDEPAGACPALAASPPLPWLPRPQPSSPQAGEEDLAWGRGWVQRSPAHPATLPGSFYLEQVALAGVGDFLLPLPVQPGKTVGR